MRIKFGRILTINNYISNYGLWFKFLLKYSGLSFIILCAVQYILFQNIMFATSIAISLLLGLAATTKSEWVPTDLWKSKKILSFCEFLLFWIIISSQRLFGIIYGLLKELIKFIFSLKFLFYIVIVLALVKYMINQPPLDWLPILIGVTPLFWLIISGRKILPETEQTGTIVKKAFACLILIWLLFLLIFLFNSNNKYTLSFDYAKYWVPINISLEFITGLFFTLFNMSIMGIIIVFPLVLAEIFEYLFLWAYSEYDKKHETKNGEIAKIKNNSWNLKIID